MHYAAVVSAAASSQRRSRPHGSARVVRVARDEARGWSPNRPQRDGSRQQAPGAGGV